MISLRETLTFDQAKMVVESKDEKSGKSLYMKGICIQGGVKNANNGYILLVKSNGLSVHSTIKLKADIQF